MKKKFGFTLVELLVAVTIILVITVAAMISYSSVNQKSRDSRRSADLEKLRLALEMYKNIEGQYPANADIDDLVTENYIDVLPVDPRDGSDYEYSAPDDYHYTYCTNNMEQQDNPYCVQSP